MKASGLLSQLSAVLAALIACAAASGAWADDFFAGKQIRLIVGTDPGGTYDNYARAISRHIGAHIPGNPTVVVQNMPGAAGIKAANYMFAVAPRDGTVISATFSGVPTAPLTNPDETRYDPTRFGWIGSATKELYVGYIWNSAPVRSMEAVRSTPVIMGGSSVGTYSVDMAILANEFFGMKFKIITGYTSGHETQMAIERGEVEGVMASAWTNLKQQADHWLAENKVSIIVQYGLKRDKRFADVPSFIEFADNEEQRQAIRFISARLDHGRPYFAPSEVPADRLEALRRAFDATMIDEAFQKDVKAMNIEIDGPMTGEDLQKFVADEAATPPSVVKRVSDALTRFKQQAR